MARFVQLVCMTAGLGMSKPLGRLPASKGLSIPNDWGKSSGKSSEALPLVVLHSVTAGSPRSNHHGG